MQNQQNIQNQHDQHRNVLSRHRRQLMDENEHNKQLKETIQAQKLALREKDEIIREQRIKINQLEEESETQEDYINELEMELNEAISNKTTIAPSHDYQQNDDVDLDEIFRYNIHQIVIHSDNDDSYDINYESTPDVGYVEVCDEDSDEDSNVYNTLTFIEKQQQKINYLEHSNQQQNNDIDLLKNAIESNTEFINDIFDDDENIDSFNDDSDPVISMPLQYGKYDTMVLDAGTRHYHLNILPETINRIQQLRYMHPYLFATFIVYLWRTWYYSSQICGVMAGSLGFLLNSSQIILDGAVQTNNAEANNTKLNKGVIVEPTGHVNGVLTEIKEDEEKMVTCSGIESSESLNTDTNSGKSNDHNCSRDKSLNQNKDCGNGNGNDNGNGNGNKNSGSGDGDDPKEPNKNIDDKKNNKKKKKKKRKKKKDTEEKECNDKSQNDDNNLEENVNDEDEKEDRKTNELRANAMSFNPISKLSTICESDEKHDEEETLNESIPQILIAQNQKIIHLQQKKIARLTKICNNLQQQLQQKFDAKKEMMVIHSNVVTLNNVNNYLLCWIDSLISKKKRNRDRMKPRKRNKKINNINPCNASYDPIPSHRARNNIYIDRDLTEKLMPLRVAENTKDLYIFMDKAIAMQFIDNKIDIDDVKENIVVIDFDFHDKMSKDVLYSVIEKISMSKGTTVWPWTMQNMLYTANEIETKYKVDIPQSSRLKIALQTSTKRIDLIKNLLQQKSMRKMIDNIKWHYIPIYRKKNNKQRITVSRTTAFMTAKVKQFMDIMSENNIKLIPIIMFNEKCYWIEFVWIVRVIKNNDIGIALKYENDGTIKITGIHLDKQYIYQQHILVSPQHIQECHCLDNWTSDITDIKIYASNLDDDENKMNTYKSKYEIIKAFIYRFIKDASEDNYKSLQQHARLLMQYDNGSLFSEIKGLLTSTVPSVHFNHTLPLIFPNPLQKAMYPTYNINNVNIAGTSMIPNIAFPPPQFGANKIIPPQTDPTDNNVNENDNQ